LSDSIYTLAYAGILFSLVTLVVQALVASFSKASQEEAVLGKIDENLSHSSFVFRAHRTFMNSLENYPTFLGSAILAVLLGADALWSGVLIWMFACSRVVHMVLYYCIATERNPSPRSYFYLLSLGANIALLILCCITLVFA
jgi:uncharacterized MAPEG superfamily protein